MHTNDDDISQKAKSYNKILERVFILKAGKVKIEIKV